MSGVPLGRRADDMIGTGASGKGDLIKRDMWSDFSRKTVANSLMRSGPLHAKLLGRLQLW
ncbi:hypothetical protein TOC8171_47910 [Pseudomonas syringae]